MNATAGETTEPTPVKNESGLIFDWSRSRRGWLRLWLFVGLALAGHAVFFYLFKVVTPAHRRPAPPAQRVVLLQDSDPQAAALLRLAEDRFPAGLLIKSDRLQTDVAELRAIVPPYNPSYADYSAQIGLPELFPLGKLPILATPAPPILPAVEGGTSVPPLPTPAATNADSSPKLLLGSHLNGRKILHVPAWPADLTLPEEPSASYLFQIAVDPEGVVRYCFADSASPPEGLRQALMTMKMEPSIRAGLIWDSVEVHW